jgi:DNA-binding response OmpR family regulator
VLRPAPGLDQFDHLGPEFRRVRGAMSLHDGHLLFQRIDVHETGSTPFDLILLDIALPDISGHEVCLRLRASERYASRRIVSLSAHVDLCDHFDMSCFDGHLLKPLALSEFESLLSDRNQAHKSS